MRKIILLFGLVLIFLGGRAWFQDPVEEFVSFQEKFSSDTGYESEIIDTMSINEIIAICNLPLDNRYRQECEVDILEAKTDFVISSSPSNIPGLNYGIHWPTEIVVKLPRFYVEGTPRVDTQGSQLLIFWYERLDTALYDSYVSDLSPLKKLNKGRITIYPLCKNKNHSF